jgi:hypothetical protein
MSMSINRDGSVTFNSDNGNGATQTFPPGTLQATVDAAYLTFQAANPVKVIPPAPTLIVLPTINPGVTGAMFLNGTTLSVSLGPTGSNQIGATGPSGATLGLQGV